MDDNSNLVGVRKAMMLTLIACTADSEIFELFKKIAIETEAYVNYTSNILLLKEVRSLI